LLWSETILKSWSGCSWIEKSIVGKQKDYCRVNRHEEMKLERKQLRE
jgi:hypothetical protein